MIVAEHSESDTASTNTLIEPPLQTNQPTPRHLGKLLITSIFMSVVAFSFYLSQTVPWGWSNFSAGHIIACILTLPYHFAALLVVWLHRHHSESIFSFKPYAPRAIGYNVVLVIFWGSATILSAITMATSLKLQSSCFSFEPESKCIDSQYRPGIDEYWPPLVSTLTSALALILVTAVAVVCYIRGQHIRKAVHELSPNSPSEHISSSHGQAKVISA